jgi:hypothetical protein
MGVGFDSGIDVGLVTEALPKGYINVSYTVKHYIPVCIR